MLELHSTQLKWRRRHPNDDTVRFGTKLVDGQVDLNRIARWGAGR